MPLITDADTAAAIARLVPLPPRIPIRGSEQGGSVRRCQEEHAGPGTVVFVALLIRPTLVFHTAGGGAKQAEGRKALSNCPEKAGA